MDDLDFSHLAPAAPKAATPAAAPASPTATQIPAKAAALPHDPQLAMRFFRIAGEEETFEAGTNVFAEGEKPSGMFAKRARMYLILEGQIALTLKGKPLYMMLPGETFGELAIISDAPRSATATALKKSRLLSLDEKRVQTSLQQAPEFALQLVSNLTGQMRRSVEKLLAANRGALVPRLGGAGLSADQLAKLRHTMGDPLPNNMKRGETVVSQGAMGVNMYVLLSGRVTIGVNGNPVEQISAGETFGEAALLSASPRAATAMAEEDGAWLPVNRDAFVKIVREHPAIGLALLRSMSGRVQHLNSQMGA